MKKKIFMDEILELFPIRPPSGHRIYSPNSYNWTQRGDWIGSYFSLARQPTELDCEDNRMCLSSCAMEACCTYCYVSLRKRKEG